MRKELSKKLSGGLTADVYWWDSSREFADTADRELSRKVSVAGWTGEDWPTAVKRAKFGRTDLVKDAESMMKELELEIGSTRSEWVPSVCGAYPIVPEALTGYPAPMRRRVDAVTDRAPLRIFIDNTCSAGVAWEDLLKRGTTYLALAMALSGNRPIELYALSVMDTRGADGAAINATRIPTDPLDTATACNTLCSMGYCRGIGYSWLQEKSRSTGRWGWHTSPVGQEEKKLYADRLREALGAGLEDVVVCGTHLDDEDVRNPVAFLKKEVARHLQTAEE